MQEDTICAIATPLGTGGVSIIRISGDEALPLLKKVFNHNLKTKIVPREMAFGTVNFGDFCDNALCVYFPKPNSFTGEDVVEINLHGGYYITKTVLEEIIKTGKIRLAEPGEFSKRAVLNGKMDISQAEGIIDLINANSHAELRASSNVMTGGLRDKINDIQTSLTDLISQVDVAIDYPDQDIEYITYPEITALLEPIKEKIQNLYDTSATGLLIKNGVTIALSGIPNAGKSSLLNALLGYERAIVTEIAGTTRDTLSESYEFNGVRFNIVDTAGIRQSNDVVEKAGIERAKKTADQADLVIHLIDAQVPITKQKLDYTTNSQVITVLNKIDAPASLVKTDSNMKFDISISAKENTNITKLKQLIFDKTINQTYFNEKVLITNTRHKQALENTIKIFEQINEAITKNDTLDCLALLLRDAWLLLGSITGENTDQKILDTIFSKFCLGK
ncbi:MAG: tRNA uridine-5-carboxymethylaminomethyl(34) synthesis GTPase MnmE [Clostridia bacterium]